MVDRALVWFRRDLRDFDHAALHAALAGARAVHCAFVFDREILDRLPDPADRRVEFIRDSVAELAAALAARGGGLIVRHAPARTAIPELAAALGAGAVYAGRDYEPAAQERDEAIAAALREQGIAFHAVKDQVIFERDEILSQAGRPFSVFTPYRNAWLKALTPAQLSPRAVADDAGALAPPPSGLATGVPALEALGFRPTNLGALGVTPGMTGGARLFRDFRDRIDRYRDARDYPAVKGPSYLSVCLLYTSPSPRD